MLRPGDPDPPRAGKFSSPDALLTPSYLAQAAQDPDIRIEPAWKVSLVYGMPCAIYHQLPAAYYLAARFRDDFEAAVLHALNGGGQNPIVLVVVSRSRLSAGLRRLFSAADHLEKSSRCGIGNSCQIRLVVFWR